MLQLSETLGLLRHFYYYDKNMALYFILLSKHLSSTPIQKK